MNSLLECSPMSRNPALNAILLGHLRAMEPHVWPGIDGLTLDVVLDSYCLAAAAGHVPDKDELLRRHPQLAGAIEALFGEFPVRARKEPQPTPLYHEHTD
jgi:hypothetical protein